jgi:purine-cytosine permease-like protein
VLYDVGGGTLPLAVAVLLIGLAALVIGLFGYHLVHIYERYSWIAMILSFCIVAGFGAPHFVNVPMGTGAAEISSVLSFGTTIIGFQFAWAAIAADYGVYMRETTKPWKAFAWSFGGLFVSQFLIEALGAAIATLISNSDMAFTTAYNSGGLGGLIGQVFEGHGTGVRNFGKFIEIILSFSTVAVIITNIYSLGLSVQMISTKLLVVPRLVWSLFGGVVLLVAALGGREHLEAVMSNFLNICAYWLTPFCTVLMLEHFCFRRGYAYDLSVYNDRTQLPYGLAAFSMFLMGTILALLCMSQTWWVGPIALAVGDPPYGTDISWEVAMGAVTLLYLPLRYLERKYWGL